LGIGDWGLGIAQSPIPNPQSPILKSNNKEKMKIFINKLT